MTCPHSEDCVGGWVPNPNPGVSGVVRCQCWRDKVAATEASRKATAESARVRKPRDVPSLEGAIDMDALESFVAYLSKHATGRDQAIPASKLAEALSTILGADPKRKLRQLAHEANDAGFPVCTGNVGYYLAAVASELDETIGRLRSEASHMNQRASRLEELKAGLEGAAEQENLL